MNTLIYTDWEYHPFYGRYSRIVYKQINKDTFEMVGREYKDL